jgi:hypothetical protein
MARPSALETPLLLLIFRKTQWLCGEGAQPVAA